MAASYPEQVLADGAVLYLRLDEASGDVVSEVGGYTGTVTGGVTRGQPGALSDGNAAMLFDGVNGKIVTTGNVSLLTPYTFEVWVRSISSTPQKVILSTLQEPTPQDALMIQMNGSGLRIYIEHSGGTSSDLSATNPFIMNDGMWHHLVIVFLGATVAVYFDGVQNTWTQQPSTPLVGSSTHVVELGTDSKYSLFYNGSLDEVAIYPIALTPQQIAAHYAARTWTAMPAWHDLRWRYCRFVRHPRWRQHAS